jgi:CRISPR/Cas system CSM-associated protein Csm2 small subunit
VKTINGIGEWQAKACFFIKFWRLYNMIDDKKRDTRRNLKINEETYSLLVKAQAIITAKTGKRIKYDELLRESLRLLIDKR